MVDDTISHYRVLDKLGQGGMGVVYKAQNPYMRTALRFEAPDGPYAWLNRSLFLGGIFLL